MRCMDTAVVLIAAVRDTQKQTFRTWLAEMEGS